MKEYPSIKTKLPGPKALKIIGQDEQYTSPSFTREYPLVVERGSGAMVEDVDGNRFLDFMAGIAVVNAGYSHPKVVEAVKKAAEKFMHICTTDFYVPAIADLAEKLARLMPKTKKRIFFGNSGTEAVEGAMKLARYHTKRPMFIAFFGAFHGRTMGSLGLTASKARQRRHFAPFLSGIHHIPFGYCYRCPYNLSYPSCNMHCVNVLEEQYFNRVMPPEDVAAIFVEPIQGEGGYVVPPPGYHKKLKSICEKYGILFVADEIQSGAGRTGKWRAIDHFDVEPDITTLAKGLASGMPISAIVASEDVMTWKPGSHGSTFGGNPVAAAAANATIELLEEKLMANAASVGAYLKEQLTKMMDRHRLIGDVRGLGLMVGVEFVKDRQTKEKAKEEAEKVIQLAFQKGLLLLTCGENVIRFAPPLVIDKEDVDTALTILDEVLTEVESKKS